MADEWLSDERIDELEEAVYLVIERSSHGFFHDEEDESLARQSLERLSAQAREANRLREELAQAEAATIAKVVEWARSQVERDTRFAESANRCGEANRSRYHFTRVEMFCDLIRHLESGEWAKENDAQ